MITTDEIKVIVELAPDDSEKSRVIGTCRLVALRPFEVLSSAVLEMQQQTKVSVRVALTPGIYNLIRRLGICPVEVFD